MSEDFDKEAKEELAGGRRAENFVLWGIGICIVLGIIEALLVTFGGAL